MPVYEVTVYTHIGSMIVAASSDQEARAKVIRRLPTFFDHGYNANLEIKAEKIKE